MWVLHYHPLLFVCLRWAWVVPPRVKCHADTSADAEEGRGLTDGARGGRRDIIMYHWNTQSERGGVRVKGGRIRMRLKIHNTPHRRFFLMSGGCGRSSLAAQPRRWSGLKSICSLYLRNNRTEILHSTKVAPRAPSWACGDLKPWLHSSTVHSNISIMIHCLNISNNDIYKQFSVWHFLVLHQIKLYLNVQPLYCMFCALI